MTTAHIIKRLNIGLLSFWMVLTIFTGRNGYHRYLSWQRFDGSSFFGFAEQTGYESAYFLAQYIALVVCMYILWRLTKHGHPPLLRFARTLGISLLVLFAIALVGCYRYGQIDPTSGYNVGTEIADYRPTTTLTASFNNPAAFVAAFVGYQTDGSGDITHGSNATYAVGLALSEAILIAGVVIANLDFHKHRLHPKMG